MNVHFNVAPRYTPGSPAQVNGPLAARVAEQERDAINGYLEGAHGEENRQMAVRIGLGGIVEERWERADCWIVRDALTDARFVRPFSVYGETPQQRERRGHRLAYKYGLPLETANAAGRPA